MSDRRAILQLLAIGRINAAQAERLMAAVSADREALWALAGCMAVALVALAESHLSLPGLAHFVQATLAGVSPALHHAWTTITISIGGMS